MIDTEAAPALHPPDVAERSRCCCETARDLCALVRRYEQEFRAAGAVVSHERMCADLRAEAANRREAGDALGAAVMEGVALCAFLAVEAVGTAVQRTGPAGSR